MVGLAVGARVLSQQGKKKPLDIGQQRPLKKPAVTHRGCAPQNAASVGDALGELDGISLGLCDGNALGSADGAWLGAALGRSVGERVGLVVGSLVAPR